MYDILTLTELALAAGNLALIGLLARRLRRLRRHQADPTSGFRDPCR
jgi:predicted tellurium resistance membrane protein TerC